jgi:hypothetical protein
MCLVTIKVSKLGSKNHWSRCVGGSPIDFVVVAGSVLVPPDLLCGLDFSIIDLISHYEIVWAAKAINCTALLAAVIFKWTKSVMFYENKVCRSVGLQSLSEC